MRAVVSLVDLSHARKWILLLLLLLVVSRSSLERADAKILPRCDLPLACEPLASARGTPSQDEASKTSQTHTHTHTHTNKGHTCARSHLLSELDAVRKVHCCCAMRSRAHSVHVEVRSLPGSTLPQSRRTRAGGLGARVEGALAAASSKPTLRRERRRRKSLAACTLSKLIESNQRSARRLDAQVSRARARVSAAAAQEPQLTGICGFSCNRGN